MVAELGKLAGDDVLTPERVLLPHPADQGSSVRIDRWAPYRSPGTMPPEEPPERTVPSENRLSADDSDSSEERGEHFGHGRDGQPITGLESRAWGGPLEDDDLLAQQGILGEESGARAEQADEGQGQAGHEFMDHRGRLSAKVGTVGIRWPAVAGETLEFRLADRVSAADSRSPSRSLVAKAIITMRNCNVMGSIAAYLVGSDLLSQAPHLREFVPQSRRRSSGHHRIAPGSRHKARGGRGMSIGTSRWYPR
jgi:hypothetical protein